MLRSVLSRKWNFLVQVDSKLVASLVEENTLPHQFETIPTKVSLRIDLSSKSFDSTGMIIAIKDLNSIVEHLLASLNSDARVWRSLDALLVYLKALLQEHLGHDQRFQLDRFQLGFENGLEVEVAPRNYIVKKDYSLKVHHSLETDAYNDQPIRHGHDMRLKVAMQYEVFKDVLGRAQEMSKVVQKEILDKYNNGFLNRYFATPSGEVLTTSFFKTLKAKGLKLFAVELEETPRNTFKTTLEATTTE